MSVRNEFDIKSTRASKAPKIRSFKRSMPYRHIIRQFVKDGFEYSLHATKGWRKISLRYR